MSWVEQMKNKQIKTNTLKGKDKLPPKQRLSQRIEEIKNSTASEITKVDQIVKAYEEYLYLTNKEALDEYWKKRKSYGDKWNPSNENMKDTIDDIEQELSKKLQKSGIDIKEITTKMGTDILEVTGQDGWNYLQFKNLVDTGQPMDLKSRQYSDTLPFSIWSRKWTPDLKGDYLGNYLYGYVGQGMLAVDGELLKYAAGAAQEISNTKSDGFFQADWEAFTSFLTGNYFDNPGDSAMIQDGIDAYNNTDKKLVNASQSAPNLSLIHISEPTRPY